MAPAHLYAETRDALERQGLSGYVDLFRAEHLGRADIVQQTEQWWDLPRLQQLYEQFLAKYAPVRTNLRRRRSVDERQAFAYYVAALTDWRRLPYSDPGLPVEVLPRDWHGVRAAETFFELRERLADQAHRFVDDVREGVERRAG